MTHDLEYAARLDSSLPPLFWYRDSHAYQNGRINLRGYGVLGPGAETRALVLEVDGHPVNAVRVGPGPMSDNLFWFAPQERRFTFEIEDAVERAEPQFAVTVRLEQTPRDRYAQSTLWQYTVFAYPEPIPSTDRIERVSGKGATGYNYFCNGYTDARRYQSIASRYGVDLSDPRTRLLDWGCGCGRLTRHFLALPQGLSRVKAIDIDPDNIDWCRRNLDEARFERVELYPPTVFSADSFDVIIANSVLTHLKRDAMDAWLREVRRILKPGGLALLSYHGDFSLAYSASRQREFTETVWRNGFDAGRRAADLDSLIGDSEYYRHTFMTDAFARDLFAKYLTVAEQIPAVVCRFQNVAVLRKT